MRRLLTLSVLLLAATPAAADPLVITKSVTTVSDPLDSLLPRALPGSIADYRTLASNPAANLVKPVRNIVLTETLPDTVDLRVLDLAGTGKGPVEFNDGSLLGTGLLSSGLTFTYSTSAPATDSVEFSDGRSWTYQPVPDANGFDRNVRAMRITLGSTFTTGTSFQLRYRVRVR